MVADAVQEVRDAELGLTAEQQAAGVGTLEASDRPQQRRLADAGGSCARG